VKKRLILFLTLFSFAVPTLGAAIKPRLVIFISIDQMRADYLERFKESFAGGLKRLTREGIVFRNADLNYAPSETGPGHAALSTGSYPSRSGILSNDWIDPSTRKEVYCVDDSSAEKVDAEGGGFSPKNLEVTALGDWLKSASPHSKVIAISAKDRAAILMGGQHANCAYWYDSHSGHMVTSEYYTHSEPEWVRSFNKNHWIEDNVPAEWTTLHPSSYYDQFGLDSVEGEMKWNGSTVFPHRFSPKKRNEQILRSPYGDMLLLDFARSAVRIEKLGQRNSTDLLCISLSCTDYVGHAFGPNSREMADQMLRLDASLGTFLSDVERMVGRGNILLALSADHAVLPLPEYTIQIEHKFARRILPQNAINPGIEALDRLLAQELNTSDHIIQSDEFLNYAAALKVGIDSLELERRVKEGLLKIDGIVDVYFRRELLATSTPDRQYIQKFRRGYFGARGKDFIIRFCENCLISTSSIGTSHGSPYDYDTHVPLIFWGTGVNPGMSDRSVYTVDVAATLATILNIPYPEGVDGKPLSEVGK
jgi:predicted AlkP superfamily pyrophosphatase or phosphodiesterase